MAQVPLHACAEKATAFGRAVLRNSCTANLTLQLSTFPAEPKRRRNVIKTPEVLSLDTSLETKALKKTSACTRNFNFPHPRPNYAAEFFF